MNIIRSTPEVSRRAFLKTASLSLALPWLHSICPAKDIRIRAVALNPAPTRFFTLFFPNGVYPSSWQATQDGAKLNFGGTLEPLSEFASKAIVIDGMHHKLGGHIGQTTGFLSGCDLVTDKFGVRTAGVSLDQILARQFASETYLPSLHLGMEPPNQGGFGRNPRSYGNSISWSSASTKIDPQVNPKLAFDQVFYGQTDEGRKLAARRKRVIDQVWGQAKALQKKVGEQDQRKLAQYFDSLRDLEVKLEKAINPSPKSWEPTMTGSPNWTQEPGATLSHTEQMRLLMDIMILAAQTDSTRVGTFVMGHSISRIIFDFVDASISENHHALSHHRNDPGKIGRYNIITQWFSAQAAYFLEKLDGIDEGNGTMLDNSVVLYGSCMKDGNTHEPLNVPIALFGNASHRLRTGRRIDCGGDTPLADLHLSLLHLFGIEADHFNQKGMNPIPGLLG